MKKKVSRFLVKVAKWLYPSVMFENVLEARQMGLCIHISKKDVRTFRKDHPSVKSHRDGLKLLIEESKWQVAGAIGRGMMKKNAIVFDIKKTPYVADVSGIAYLYAPKEEKTVTGEQNG